MNRDELKAGAGDSYVKFFETEDEAMSWMRLKNQTAVRGLYVVAPGPEDNWAVTDLRTAIELGSFYRWEATASRRAHP